MPKGYPNPKPPTPAVHEQPGQIPTDGFTLPDAIRVQEGSDLLLDACNVFGVNPDPSLPIYAGRGRGPFRELMAWKFYPGDSRAGIPDAVVFVTVGGTKVRYTADPDFPMDPDTETRLRNVFHAWKTDPKTNEIIALPLPTDLTLPRSAVSSVVETAHQYKGGYLRRKPADAKNAG